MHINIAKTFLQNKNYKRIQEQLSLPIQNLGQYEYEQSFPEPYSRKEMEKKKKKKKERKEMVSESM